MTSISIITRRVTKRGKRVLEYRARLTSKGRVTFSTPQWYSRRLDVVQMLRHFLRDIRLGHFAVMPKPSRHPASGIQHPAR